LPAAGWKCRNDFRQLPFCLSSKPAFTRTLFFNSRYFKNTMNYYRFLPFVLFLFALSLTAPACSQKSGCPANESLQAKTNKKGDLKKSRGGKSGLFPKKMAKRMK